MIEYCGALNASGTRCRNNPVAETGGWRCMKHADWIGTKEEREKLALIEIQETVEALGPIQEEDLDTKRPGMRGLWNQFSG